MLHAACWRPKTAGPAHEGTLPCQRPCCRRAAGRVLHGRLAVDGVCRERAHVRRARLLRRDSSLAWARPGGLGVAASAAWPSRSSAAWAAGADASSSQLCRHVHLWLPSVPGRRSSTADNGLGAQPSTFHTPTPACPALAGRAGWQEPNSRCRNREQWHPGCPLLCCTSVPGPGRAGRPVWQQPRGRDQPHGRHAADLPVRRQRAVPTRQAGTLPGCDSMLRGCTAVAFRSLHFSRCQRRWACSSCHPVHGGAFLAACQRSAAGLLLPLLSAGMALRGLTARVGTYTPSSGQPAVPVMRYVSVSGRASWQSA